MGVKAGEKRLNVDIPAPLKKRIDVYVAKEGENLKVVVSLALETFLDEMGAEKF